jgi:hypothetical protein
MAATPDGGGYWLVAADGGVFTFGDAHYYGSTGATPNGQHAVGIGRTHSGHGYWVPTTTGAVTPEGDAPVLGP